jgi:hypothetical protein
LLCFGAGAGVSAGCEGEGDTPSPLEGWAGAHWLILCVQVGCWRRCNAALRARRLKRTRIRATSAPSAVREEMTVTATNAGRFVAWSTGDLEGVAWAEATPAGADVMSLDDMSLVMVGPMVG